MTKPKPIQSHNLKNVEFYIRGWNDGQQETEQSVRFWVYQNFKSENGDLTKEGEETLQSLLSAMEHS